MPAPAKTARRQLTMPADICCAHPNRALSPIEPSRPAIVALDGIFAVAALPSDHPHALRIERPPEVDRKLIRSPSIASKLKGHLRRKPTVKSLRADVYDEDAQPITSTEVVESIERAAAAQPRARSCSPPRVWLRSQSPFSRSPELKRYQRASRSTIRRSNSSASLFVSRKGSPLRQRQASSTLPGRVTEEEQLEPPAAVWTLDHRGHPQSSINPHPVGDPVLPGPSHVRISSSVYSRPTSPEKVSEHATEPFPLLEVPIPEIEIEREEGSKQSLATTKSKSTSKSKATAKSEGTSKSVSTNKSKRSTATSSSWRTRLFKMVVKPVRSFSLPHLRKGSMKTVALFDGPPDEPEMEPDMERSSPNRLRVSLDDVEVAPEVKRSKSSGQRSSQGEAEMAAEAHQAQQAQQMLRAPVVHRSLAAYERSLSVSGDSRRRPSAASSQHLDKIQEEARRDSAVPPTRKPSRVEALMESALERQLQEKDMFRSASKRSRSVSHASGEGMTPSFQITDVTPSFQITEWADANRLPESADNGETIDPLDKTRESLELPAIRVPAQYPSQPALKPAVSSASTAPSLPKTPSRTSESWTKFPSHTRPDRCGSAGPNDHIIARDFALESSPASKKKVAVVKHGFSRSRSATFGSVVRHYTTMLASANISRGRRTSTATGGLLEHPELEMLPPVVTPFVAPSQSTPLMRHKSDEALMSGGASGLLSPGARKGVDKGSMSPSRHTPDSSDESVAPEDTRPSHHTDGAAETEADQYLNLVSGLEEDFDRASNHRFEELEEDLHRPISPEVILREPSSIAMPPPVLKSIKYRGSEDSQQHHLDPHTKIRHFPSVTVIDDRKGHWRSVSLISAKSNQSGQSGQSGQSFFRKSSNDLLRMLQDEEQKALEKLMLK